MVASLFLTAIGFIFAFVANAENPSGIAPGLISFACVSNYYNITIKIVMIYINTGDKHNSLCLWNNSISSSNYQCKFLDTDIIKLSIMYIDTF